MQITELIGPDQVIVGLRVAGKPQLLHELARRAAIARSMDQSVVFDALMARERLGSTGFGKGFALPHARIPALPEVFGLFVRLARPIDFAAVDERPVDLVILLLTQASESAQHLPALAAISRPLRDEAFVRRLRQAPDARAVYEVLARG